MTGDVAELETRPAGPNRNETPDAVPTPRNDDPPQQEDGKPTDDKVQEADKLAAPLPRWPLFLAGLVVVIFAAGK